MEIIPVIDIKNGVVVRANRGDRSSYAPLKSPFASTPSPDAVVDGILEKVTAKKFYIADLDAIEGLGDNTQTITAIAEKHTAVSFWIDAGLDHLRSVDTLLAAPNIDLVLATESISSIARYNKLRNAIPYQRMLLSLDRLQKSLLGCAELFHQPSLWPQRIIHMNLSVIGTSEGPDWAGLKILCRRSGNRDIYAAGGVRDDSDIKRLASLGISGVLVATALHNSRISFR